MNRDDNEGELFLLHVVFIGELLTVVHERIITGCLLGNCHESTITVSASFHLGATLLCPAGFVLAEQPSTGEKGRSRGRRMIVALSICKNECVNMLLPNPNFLVQLEGRLS